jgi:hypothetical protein
MLRLPPRSAGTPRCAGFPAAGPLLRIRTLPLRVRRLSTRPGLRTPFLALPAVLLCALLCTLLSRPASADAGHLRIVSPSSGSVLLKHETEWVASFSVNQGLTTIWSLPAGEYEVTFFPGGTAVPGAAGASLAGGTGASGRPAEPAGASVRIWDGLTSRIEVDAGTGLARQWEGPDDAGGAALLLPRTLLEALPGKPVEVLAAMDTHIRSRPSLLLDGLNLAPAAERCEVPSGLGGPAGGAAATLSPGFADGARWSLTSGWSAIRPRARGLAWGGQAPLPLHVTAGFEGSRHEDEIVTGQGRIDPLSLLGVPLAGHFWVRHASRPNASPRAVGARILPHNDARDLAMIGRLDFGSPTAGILPGAGAAAPPEAAHPDRAAAGSWGLALKFAASGSRRDHYEQVYRYDLDHAPHEETAFVQSEADFTRRLGARGCGKLSLGYRSYETSFSDGVYREDLQAYVAPGGNSDTDESGLYWQGSPAGDAHVYDYYRWQSERQWRGRAQVEWASGAASRVEAGADVRFLTYRRFEHFSPTELGAFGPGGTLADALVIGYDPERGRPADDPFDPGGAFSGRLTARIQRTPRPGLHLDLAAGGLLFSARDSVLASLRTPLGEDYAFDAADLEPPVWHLRPEARLAIARRDPRSGDGRLDRGLEWWGVLFQQAHQPPLEALYAPRAYLMQADPEGVMGNPALAPEIERGAEIGLSFPAPFSLPSRLLLSGYASRVSDALAVSAAQVGAGRGWSDTDWVPAYENGGTLFQRGLHLEALAGRAEGVFWARFSYDLSRIESDRLEPSLLDGRWLYPEDAPGEYESEGYAGPLGSSVEELLGDLTPAAVFRPANLDRLHRFSLAFVARPHPASRLLNGWEIGVTGRVETGRPYTQVYVYSAGLPAGSADVPRGPDDPAWEQAVPELDRNAGRMPAQIELDLALTRRFALGGRQLTFGVEALNLFGRENVIAVYRATGEADEDGCLGTATCPAESAGLEEVEPAAYGARLLDPAHYGIPLLLRGWLRFELF